MPMLRPLALLLIVSGLPLARAAEPDREQVRKALADELSRPPLAGAHVGVAVLSMDDGSLIFAHDPDTLLNPASNVKLFTAAAALARLGPEYRFSTEFFLDKPIPSARTGKTKGNLYVRGKGDPTLSPDRLWQIGGTLVHRGLKQVAGDLVLDGSFFDNEKAGPGWEQETTDKSYAAFVGPLSVNKNVVSIYVGPGDAAGQRARVEVEPASAAIVVDNQVVTAPMNGRRRVIARIVALPDGRTRVVVSGRVQLRREGEMITRRIADPDRFAGETIKSIFAKRGLTIHGKVRRGTAPVAPAVPFYVAESISLAEVVREMNKISSNFDAEMMLKTLGAEQAGAPGTWAKGVGVAEQFLAEVGIPRGSYVMKNGSGLNDTNRFTARQVAMLLLDQAKRWSVAPEYEASLGIAGRDGTVRTRMEGTEAAGRVRAKTGTLEGVTALSGYVQAASGARFVFSILANDVASHTKTVASIDRLGAAMAAQGTPGGPAQAVAVLDAHETTTLPELKARVATYTSLGRLADKRNLPFLRTALRTEHDPVLKAVVADALYQSDPDAGGGALLEAFTPTAEFLGRLRAVGTDLGMPTPAINSLIDLGAEGNSDALERIVELAPLVIGDAPLEAMLSEGLCEIGRTAPDELLAAFVNAGNGSRAALELAARGISLAADKTEHPFVKAVKTAAETGGAPQKAVAASFQESLSGNPQAASTAPEAKPVTAEKVSGG